MAESLTNELVQKHVIWFLSGATLLKPEKIYLEYVLKDFPLLLDDKKLGNLTLQLRGYVQQYKPNATVLAPEVRKKGLTVSALVDLIVKKVK